MGDWGAEQSRYRALGGALSLSSFISEKTFNSFGLGRKDPDGKNKSRPSNALRIHRVLYHNWADFGVEITILPQNIQISARKAFEAFWIHAENPKMNRKE